MEQVSLRYEEYAEAREREHYRAHSGQQDAPELDELDDRFADVTQGEGIAPLRAALEQQTLSGERDATQRMLHLLEQALLDATRWSLSAELRRPGTDPAARDERSEQLFAELGEARLALGYANGRAHFCARYPDVDLGVWERGADRLLEVTEGAYRDRLEPALGRARTAPSDAKPADLQRLLSTSAFDAMFPCDKLEDLLDYTTQGLRMRLAAVARIDAEPRPGRAFEAASFALRVPQEVVLSCGTATGVPASRAFFFAAGASLHAAFTSAELPVERRLGVDPAVRWGFGLLLAERFGDPVWLAQSPAEQRALEFAQEAELLRLLRLRLAAARFRFELALSEVPGGDDPHRLAERYAEEHSLATRVPWTPEGYLDRARADLVALHELRAWCLAEQLADFLRHEFGRAFWTERRAGELLKEIWHTGATYAAEALASELGFAPLDLEHVIAATPKSS
jgi:hypothetical protein